MLGGRVYLDHNATAPIRPDVATACLGAFGAGNPSSTHREGQAARALVEAARLEVAAAIGARSAVLTLTSGGTEANATALRPRALLTRDGRPVTRLLIAATEHLSALSGHGFAPEAVIRLPVDSTGLVEPGQIDRLLRATDEPTLVSVQMANSETGVIQPTAAIAAVTKASGAVFHADAVQAVGRIVIDFDASGVDAVTLSAHKLGGPMGSGALVIRAGRPGPAFALLRGGGQERGARAGTENVAASVGFGVAAKAACRDVAGEHSRLAALREEAERGLLSLSPDAVVFGAGAERLPNTVAFAVPGLRAETALMALDLAGVAVSSGSACSSGKVGRSHVLAAMGVSPDLASGVIRLSFGWNSTTDDVAFFLDAFEIMLQRLYQRGRARAA